MYKFLLLIITLVVFGCSSNVSELELRIAKLETEMASLKRGGSSSIVTQGSFPKFQFDKEEHNFGEIYDGDIVTHTFSFKNVGETPFIIAKATASCGCTVPSWPKRPIPAGSSGQIKVQFDSSNKPGIQNKVITITANTETKIKKLLIKAQVSPRS